MSVKEPTSSGEFPPLMKPKCSEKCRRGLTITAIALASIVGLALLATPFVVGGMAYHGLIPGISTGAGLSILVWSGLAIGGLLGLAALVGTCAMKAMECNDCLNKVLH